MESGAPVSPDYSSNRNRLSGEVSWVHPGVTGNDHDRHVSAEERFQAARTGAHCPHHADEARALSGQVGWGIRSRSTPGGHAAWSS
jgi:hypothetical protein